MEVAIRFSKIDYQKNEENSNITLYLAGRVSPIAESSKTTLFLLFPLKSFPSSFS